MERERWQQLEALYHAVLKVDPSQRAEFVRMQCGEDESLRCALDSLLRQPVSVDSVFDHPAFEVAARLLNEQAADGSSAGDPLIGITVANFKILEKIDEGGMGVVYNALDLALHRQVALKFLPELLSREPAALERFRREARAASALNHPNICTIHEIGEHDGNAFIVMELIEGISLRQRITLRTLKIADIVNLGIEVASGLAAAHTKGIIHRDIKPANIFVTSDGRAKILDFGLAKVLRGHVKAVAADATADISLTVPGATVGTTAYMSPEQARGENLDTRTDLFSLGATLYEMATGVRAFQGKSLAEIHDAILNRQPKPATEINSEVPPRLQEVIAKAMEKDPALRYQSAGEMRVDLYRLTRALEFRSPAEDAQEIPPAFIGRKRRLVTAGLGVIVVLAITASILPRSPKLTDKDTIVLADFNNSTGDAVFDGTLKQALAVQLGQSPFMNILSDERVRESLHYMGRSPDERVTRDSAQEICQRQGIKALLAGSISSLGSHYVITLEALNCQTGETITRGQREAESKEEVLRTLGQVTTTLRKRLGESISSIQKFDAPIEQATTVSLEALKVYSLGREQHLQGHDLEAIPLYKRATEIDPNFALAYANLSRVYSSSGQYDLANESSTKAYNLRSRVSERERLHIMTDYYDSATGDVDTAIETYQLWKRTYPRDADAPNHLAFDYNELGRYDKAAEEAREAIRLNPNSALGYSNLAEKLVSLNRFDEAKEVIAQSQAMKLESTRMHTLLYQVAFIEGDALAMEQQVEWANGRPDEYIAQSWQAEASAFSGQLRNAQEFFDRAFGLAQLHNLKEGAATILANQAWRLARLEDCRQAKDKTRQALAISHNWATMVDAANALAMCGEARKPQSLADELVRRFPKSPIVNKVWLPNIAAIIEMQRGNTARAVELLEVSRPYDESGSGGQLSNSTVSLALYLRGQGYLRQKKGSEAAAEFQKILDHRGWSPTSQIYPLAYLGLARAAALTSETAKARKSYHDFLALWKDADPDIPILKQAKAEYAKLQ